MRAGLQQGSCIEIIIEAFVIREGVELSLFVLIWKRKMTAAAASRCTFCDDVQPA
jgi:hypothetical protein